MSTDFRFIGISPSVDLTERKSKLINDQTEPFTLDEMRGYKVFTALLTQSGGDDPQIVYGDSQSLFVGITYQILVNPNNFDFTPYGAPNSEVGTYFICTTAIALDENPDSSITQLSQNAGAPVVTVLENTIGNIWFTYQGVGAYNIYSVSLFTIGKKISLINTGLLVEEGSAIISNYPNDSFIGIYNANQAFESGDGYLNNTPIEIRVYN